LPGRLDPDGRLMAPVGMFVWQEINDMTLQTVAMAREMSETDLKRVFDELQQVIEQARGLLDRFEAADMAEVLDKDYQATLDIHAEALRQQAAIGRCRSDDVGA